VKVQKKKEKRREKVGQIRVDHSGGEERDDLSFHHAIGAAGTHLLDV
jgi:hypothetical protein